MTLKTKKQRAVSAFMGKVLTPTTSDKWEAKYIRMKRKFQAVEAKYASLLTERHDVVACNERVKEALNKRN